MKMKGTKIGLTTIVFLLLASCQIKKQARPYKLTRKDKKILEQLKQEDAKEDSILKARLKDPDYLEYVKKTNAENKPTKN